MRVDKIYINTHRYDIEMTRACVASVRYWYPEIPISLIFDHSNGPGNFSALCRKWNVDVLNTQNKKYGWGFGKFEPLFLEKGEYFLVLDADTVFSGPVLDKIYPLEADFVVDEECQPLEKVKSLYYDPEKVKEIYADFVYPGYTFNTGQWIGRSGIIQYSDFDDLIEWQPSPHRKYPEIFQQADQGIFNLLIHHKERQGLIRVKKVPLMVWPENGAGDFIQLSSIKGKKPDFPFVIHWAGMKAGKLRDHMQGDILVFYERFYYSRFNIMKKWLDKAGKWWLAQEKKVRYKIKNLKTPASI